MPATWRSQILSFGGERPGHEAITSTITMTELLVPSYCDHDEHRVDAFYGLLSTYPNLQWIAPDLETADLAAKLRALHRLRTPNVCKRPLRSAHGRRVSSPMIQSSCESRNWIRLYSISCSKLKFSQRLR
jgi:hypothetical protein